MVTRGFMVVSRKDCKGAKTQKEITIHMRRKIFSTMREIIHTKTFKIKFIIKKNTCSGSS